jgi:hypothetical protein
MERVEAEAIHDSGRESCVQLLLDLAAERVLCVRPPVPGAAASLEPAVGRHQIAELPPISVIWSERRTHHLRCRHCLAPTSARLPDGIGGCAFGSRLQRACEALAGPHLQLKDWPLGQPAVHGDETGLRTRGEGRALWTATTPDAAVFAIAENCNRDPFKRPGRHHISGDRRL